MIRAVAIVIAFAKSVCGLENGLAMTPPMGFLSWQRFACEIDCARHPNRCVNADLYKSMADEIVNRGLRELGYIYVNIDDCWSEKTRSPDGYLYPDSERFGGEAGMIELAQYMHDRGLRLGLYSDVGTATCEKYPAMLDSNGNSYIERDISKFIEWGIDSLKVDGCNADVSALRSLYTAVGAELRKSTERPILYSCSWPAYTPDHCENEEEMSVLQETCNLWRNYLDVHDTWERVKQIVNFWDRPRNDLVVQAAGPGHWNDPDMLVIGNPGLSLSEQKAQFALWAIFAAPLYMSTDLRTISEDSLAILKNEKIIAVNQDRLGRQGFRVSDDGVIRVWLRELSSAINTIARVAVVFENKRGYYGPVYVSYDVGLLAGSLGYDVISYFAENLYSDRYQIQSMTDGSVPFELEVDVSSVEMFIFTMEVVPGTTATTSSTLLEESSSSLDSKTLSVLLGIIVILLVN